MKTAKRTLYDILIIAVVLGVLSAILFPTVATPPIRIIVPNNSGDTNVWDVP